MKHQLHGVSMHNHVHNKSLLLSMIIILMESILFTKILMLSLMQDSMENNGS